MSATGRFRRADLAAIQAAISDTSDAPAVRDVPGKTQRARGDFYETPPWAIDAILQYIPLKGEPIVVDAGAGTGAIAARLVEKSPSAEIIGVEKYPDLVERARARGLASAEFVQGNFLRWTPELARPDVVIMNPPFSFALPFVERALEIVRRGGTVAALLRLNWLAGKSRREWHKKHPSDVFVLCKRPSFTGSGTDATDYAWFVWGPERGGRYQILPAPEKVKRSRAARTPTQATASDR